MKQPISPDEEYEEAYQEWENGTPQPWDDDDPEECCAHCGKPFTDFSDLGCGHCDARHPAYGILR